MARTKQKAERLMYSASVMCADLMHLARDVAELEDAGCDELHFDIMDGLFVPNMTLGPGFVKAAKGLCGLPCSAHLMISEPQRYIGQFAEAGADSITVHIETDRHIHRALMQVRDAGVSPGVAIDPATPLTKLDYVLELVDRVLVMTVDPGFAGQRIIPNAFERVRILSENIAHRNLPVRLEVDGNIDVRNAAMLAEMGAEIFVLGTSSIFGKERQPLGASLNRFREAVAAERHLV